MTLLEKRRAQIAEESDMFSVEEIRKFTGHILDRFAKKAEQSLSEWTIDDLDKGGILSIHLYSTYLTNWFGISREEFVPFIRDEKKMETIFSKLCEEVVGGKFFCVLGPEPLIVQAELPPKNYTLGHFFQDQKRALANS